MIETGGQYGMQTLDSAIAGLVQKGQISREAAMTKASDPERLERLLGRSNSKPVLNAVKGRVHPDSTHPSRIPDPVDGATEARTGFSRRPWE